MRGGSPEDPPVFHRRIIGSCCHRGVDHRRPDDAYFLARLRKRRRARIVGRLLAQGAALVAVLASGWWGVSALGAHTVASEASRRPVYVAGCPLSNTLEKSQRGVGCSQEGASHPITSRQPGAGLASKHAHGAEK